MTLYAPAKSAKYAPVNERIGRGWAVPLLPILPRMPMSTTALQ
eukprot:g66428.t1